MLKDWRIPRTSSGLWRNCEWRGTKTLLNEEKSIVHRYICSTKQVYWSDKDIVCCWKYLEIKDKSQRIARIEDLPQTILGQVHLECLIIYVHLYLWYDSGLKYIYYIYELVSPVEKWGCRQECPLENRFLLDLLLHSLWIFGLCWPIW